MITSQNDKFDKMTVEIRIGNCGYGRTKKPDYAARLNCVEIQHTFYKPPQVKTLEGWRSEMPEGFEFTLKAWQFITHEGESPTYRRLKRELTEKERKEVAGSISERKSCARLPRRRGSG